MKTPHLTLAIICALLYITPTQALPPDVAQLIQDDKYSEALARVDALLKTTPDNAELLKIRADLAKQVPSTVSPTTASIPEPQLTRFNDLVAAGKLTEAAKVADALASFYPDDPRLPQLKAKLATPAASQPPEPPPASNQPAQPTGMERIAYNATLLLIQQAQQAPDNDTRIATLKRFLKDSEPLALKYPSLLPLWQSRAAVALDLNDARAGVFAAANLLKLGSADSPDPSLQQLLAQLQLKGWIDPDKYAAYVAQDKVEADHMEAEAAAKLKRIKDLAAMARSSNANAVNAFDELQTLAPGSPEAVELKSKFADLNDASNPQTWLRKALKTAPLIQEAFFKTDFLWQVGSAFAGAGNLAAAQKATAQLKDEDLYWNYSQNHLLAEYAEWQAKHGDIAGAMQNAAQINSSGKFSSDQRDSVYGAVVEAQIKRGDISSAQKTVIMQSKDDAMSVSLLAKHFAKSGDFESAYRVIEQLKTPDAKTSAYYWLGETVGSSGQQSKAEKCFEKARALTADMEPIPKEVCIQFLAISEAKAGCSVLAVKDITKTKNALTKKMKSGDDSMANIDAGNIAEVYVRLNDNQSLEAFISEFNQHYRNHKERGERRDGSDWFGLSLFHQGLARLYMELGKPEKAAERVAFIKALANQVYPDPNTKDSSAQYLWGCVVESQCIVGDFEGAQTTLSKIQITKDCYGSISSNVGIMASLWVQHGNFEGLNSWIDSLGQSTVKPYALLGVAEGLKEKADKASAK